MHSLYVALVCIYATVCRLVISPPVLPVCALRALDFGLQVVVRLCVLSHYSTLLMNTHLQEDIVELLTQEQ